MLEDLAGLIEIESVQDEAGKDAPFGNNLKKALDWFLDKAESFGLETGRLDGYCGWADTGRGKKCIGLACHLDVVPAGGGWSYPPFKLTNDNGFLYGRGVMDNKGPAIVMLHVLKGLKESGVKLNNRIRLIAGCNEETGSLCLKHYRKFGELPKFTIVPDADFPVINSEKGILHLEVSIPADETFRSSVINFSAGQRPNVVPGAAEIELSLNGFFAQKTAGLIKASDGGSPFLSTKICGEIIGAGYKPEDFTLTKLEDKIVLEARGIAGHAMAPEKGDNAITKLFTLLEALNKPCKSNSVNTVYSLFCTPLTKEKLSLDVSDPESGALTFNFGKVKFADGALTLVFDLRLPKCCSKDEAVKKIGDSLPAGASVKILHHSPNLYIDPDSALIKTLLKVYSETTGLPAFTVQTGGGTYARELPSAVAFGATFPGAETFIHNADERISVEHFFKLPGIYTRALLELDKL